jgi:arsenate reductase
VRFRAPKKQSHDKYTITHCGKSRNCVAYIEEGCGKEYEIIKYLENPPTLNELAAPEKLNFKPLELVRQKRKNLDRKL